MNGKVKLRAEYRKIRQKIPAIKKVEYTQKIITKLQNLVENYTDIAIYNALAEEINIANLSAKNLLLPKVQLDKSLKFFSAKEELVIHHQYKILEPKGITEFIPQVIICPLLAFDKNKNRIGYGGGYYDRSFKIYTKAIKIGVAYMAQETEKITKDKYDVPLDYIVTEDKIFI